MENDNKNGLKLVDNSFPKAEKAYPYSDSMDSSGDFKSRKFFAYIISIFISLGCFVLVYKTKQELSAFDKFLNFMLWALVAYIGGNSAEKISNKIGPKL